MFKTSASFHLCPVAICGAAAKSDFSSTQSASKPTRTGVRLDNLIMHQPLLRYF